MACLLRGGRRCAYDFEHPCVGCGVGVRSVLEVPADFENSRLYDGGSQVHTGLGWTWRTCHGVEAHSCIRKTAMHIMLQHLRALVLLHLCALHVVCTSCKVCFSTSSIFCTSSSTTALRTRRIRCIVGFVCGGFAELLTDMICIHFLLFVFGMVG